jgi:hypothetical protein
MGSEKLPGALIFLALAVIIVLFARYGSAFLRMRTVRTLCRDGWLSSSVGRGCCSWHGGVA